MLFRDRLAALLLFLFFLAPVPALAQTARVVANCGTLPQTYVAGSTRDIVQDVNGNSCNTTTISQGGSTATVSLDGALNVNTPASPQFSDTFSSTLDTTTNWTAKNSTGTAANASGQLVLNSSTTASAYGGVFSQQTFAPVGVSPQVWGQLASFTVIAQANSARVLGMATVPGTPTTAVPVTDGYIYRLDGTGALFAEIWSAGVAISSTNVTASCLPAANIPAIFAISYRASLVQFICGTSTASPIATIVGINPANQVLPVMALSIAGSTPPAASAVMNLSAVALATVSPGAVKSANQNATINDPYTVVGQSPNVPQTYPTSYATGTVALAGNGSGTTGAVVGTITASATTTAYICGFNVQAAGTGLVGPIVVAGLIGSSQTYQGSAVAAGGAVAAQTFSPCIPASAANTNITITTTADATATAVNVNSWGYRQ